MRQSQLSPYMRAVPRYTSYPTAPHFHEGVTAELYANWLRALPDNAGLSLYIHIPFCDRLCWFCGCTTKQTKRYEPIAAYLQVLKKEIKSVAGLLAGRGHVTALHFGGGSPSMLMPDDILWLNDLLRQAFAFDADAEVSVEIDPSDMDEAKYDAWAGIGVNRVSLGVQDFDDKVQKAINRGQSFEQTKAVTDAMRARGVASVNLDVLYGLPFQTEQSMAQTIEKCLALMPDRLALFGYAHVPWMKKHQRLIDETALPSPAQRFAQQQLAAERLTGAGYQPIGIDHFARPEDSLAIADRKGRLRRNFQGYTTDAASALIGLGASSISQLPQGYVQATAGSGDYRDRINADGLAAVRGIELSEEDKARAYVIERLMCDFALSICALTALHPEFAGQLVGEAMELAASEPNRYFRREGERFVIASEGHGFTRTMAAHFDTYLQHGTARHSIAV